MMKSIVEEKLVSFKLLEQKVFAYVCELGRMITQTILENYDDELARERDKKYTETKESVILPSRPYTGKSNTPGGSTGQSQGMERQRMFICWIRQCRWKRSGCSPQTLQKRLP